MKAAHDKGDKYYGAQLQRSGVRPPSPPKVPPVFVLTSSHCFSACLDFLDRAKMLPGMRHIGEPTGADTDYMENWGGRLPSGLSQLSHPMKVYRNRRRAHNEPYTPDRVFAGSIRDTEAIASWIRTLK